MKSSQTAAQPPSRILFGAAYYAEYHREERTEADLDLMKAAGFTVIRVGESVWSTWEPRDGEFDLDWLQPVLDGAHERGIAVILGTPTYAVPPWLQTAYPEIAAERRTGEPMPWGARQEVDYSHPAFRFHAERVIRAVVAPLRRSPRRDRLPGRQRARACCSSTTAAAFQRFVRRLQGEVRRRRDPQPRVGAHVLVAPALATGRTCGRPDGNTLPQYDLAWRRYQADLTTEFIAWQADIVREYARPGQFVTTCIAYPRPAIDDEALVEALDVTAGNPYYAMQDHLDATKSTSSRVTPWTTTGVAALFRQADRMFSSNQSRFLVTETDAQSIGGSEFNLPPYPGPAGAGGLRVHLARRGDDRVLALAHAALRHRDLLGRRASAQPGSRPRLPRARRRSAASSRRSAISWTGTSPTRTSRSSGRPTAASRSSSSRRSPTADGTARSRVVPAHLRRVPPRRRRRRRAGADPAYRSGARARSGGARARGSPCSSPRRSTSRPTPTSTCCATTPPPAGTS